MGKAAWNGPQDDGETDESTPLAHSGGHGHGEGLSWGEILTSPRWWVGTICVLLGVGGMQACYYLVGPLLALPCMTAINLLIVLIGSAMCLGEKFRCCVQGLVCVGVIAGIGIFTYFCPP